MGCKIEHNVPVAEKRVGYHSNWKYPWRKMKVGDSFLVTDILGNTLQNLRAGACNAQKRHGWKFAVRLVDDGIRVWRVE